MEENELKQKVKLFLAEKELTQEEFAKEIEISRSRVNGWLNGHFELQPKTFTKITEKLGIVPVGERPPFTPLDRVIDHLNKANRELDNARDEVEEMSSYLMKKINELVRFKHFLREINSEKPKED
ncbi:hypothetical protein ES703_45109 [subsurface metagenome]